MRCQDLERLPERINLLVVVGDDNCVDHAVGSDVSFNVVLRFEITSFAARGRASISRRGQGLGAGQRGGRAATTVGELHIAKTLVAGSLGQALGEIPDGPAGAQREHEDEEMDQQAVVGEDGLPDTGPLSSCKGGSAEVVVLLELVSMPLRL
jgi:hypothetical protein